jgi:TrmH family RNA methyltransferase
LPLSFAWLASHARPQRTSRVLTKAEVQRLRSLRDQKQREALGLFVVEGEKVVSELLAAKFSFTEIYTTGRAGFSPPSVSAAGQAEARPTRHVIAISADEMARISHFPTPSTVFAVGRIVRTPLPPRALDRGFTLALDGVQDPGNVGTLLRIADWFAFDRLVLSPDSADLFHQKVVNASMGSFARVTVHSADLPAAFATVASGTPILGCELAGENIHTLSALPNAIVAIGSEGRGLSAALKPFVTHHVTIPKFGQAESLNAAVAAAIVCDNLRRLQSA